MMEGNHCYDPPSNCNPNGTHVLPVYEWQHGGVPFRCSVTGGKVYRGGAMADMHGRFFFADYCSGEVWSARWDGQQLADFADHTPELAATLGTAPSIVGFGTDADGEIYILTAADGGVHKLVPAGLRLVVGPLAAGAAVTVSLTGGTPAASVALLYSVAGLGATDLPRVNVTLGITQPALAAASTADALGAAVFAGTVPAALQDRTIWFQAVQRDLKSNIAVAIVR
jgi:hypothetical protein